MFRIAPIVALFALLASQVIAVPVAMPLPMQVCVYILASCMHIQS